MRLNVPNLRDIFNSLPIEAAKYLMYELQIPWDEAFHCSNEPAFDYIWRSVHDDLPRFRLMLSLLMFADTLIVYPEDG